MTSTSLVLWTAALIVGTSALITIIVAIRADLRIRRLMRNEWLVTYPATGNPDDLHSQIQDLVRAHNLARDIRDSRMTR